MLHPEQILRRDLDGNLPIHIAAASKDASDEETFLCVDCFSKKSKLVNVDCSNGYTKYCCETCVERVPIKISKTYCIRPGT